jgi:hypothetical protein
MNEESTQTSSASPQTVKPHAAVSVSDDAQSMISSLVASPSAQPLNIQHLHHPLVQLPTHGIIKNAELVQRSIARRNEEERMRVALASLYHAFLEAVQQER